MEGFSMNNSTTNYGKTSGSGCNGTKYVIKKGDTLYSISRRYNVPLALILRANPYVDVYNLQIGDEICVPGEQQQDFAQTLKPPVVTGPAPVVFPVHNAVRQPVSDSINTQTRTVEGVSESMTAVPIQETVTTPVEDFVMDTTPISNVVSERDSVSDSYSDSYDTASRVELSQNISNPTREVASRNTFNFNLYSGNTNSSVDNDSVIRRRRQTERLRHPGTVTPREKVESPTKRPQQENQTMGMYFAKPETQEPSVKMRSVIKPTMAASARMIAPVRIIAQPKAMMESDTCFMEDRQKARNWSSYQDRERFNTIMYNADQMKCGSCNREKRCTENIAVPDDRKQEKMAVIGYVSREDDSLQDILDYFTISMDELLQYNGLDEFKLKPGCMLQVPNSCNEL